ncbi:ankyrin [Aspergillus phoenicis ATCC 13157]|uniref:Ankyrin n=1 Tax=Aspergillus phoenicis ATCC 13157 TaxID=1353007 RepID=A0A370P3Z9_ASPPH|nr:ankyrin [Aspergillus phoenicis ATCC 13157]
MPLVHLPPELVPIIAGHLKSEIDLNCFAQTSQCLYRWVNPCLYQCAVRTMGESLLHWAASKGQLQTLLKLLAFGAKLPANNQNTTTDSHPISTAATYGCVNIIDVLLDLGTDIEYPAGVHGDTPLMIAVREGHLPVVRRLLERGANPTLPNKLDHSPLEVAIIAGSLAVTERLISHVKDLPHTAEVDSLGRALCAAARSRQVDIVKMLLCNGAPVNYIHHQQLETALINATRTGDNEITRLLLDHGADPMIGFETWDSPALACAAWRNHQSIVEMLVKKDPRVGRHFADAMVEAANLGLEDMASYFLLKGANPDHLRSGYRTPLSCAAQHGHVGVVRVLLTAGADPEANDNHGRTPNWYASWLGCPEVLALLREHITPGACQD